MRDDADELWIEALGYGQRRQPGRGGPPPPGRSDPTRSPAPRGDDPWAPGAPGVPGAPPTVGPDPRWPVGEDFERWPHRPRGPLAGGGADPAAPGGSATGEWPVQEPDPGGHQPPWPSPETTGWSEPGLPMPAGGAATGEWPAGFAGRGREALWRATQEAYEPGAAPPGRPPGTGGWPAAGHHGTGEHGTADWSGEVPPPPPRRGVAGDRFEGIGSATGEWPLDPGQPGTLGRGAGDWGAPAEPPPAPRATGPATGEWPVPSTPSGHDPADPVPGWPAAPGPYRSPGQEPGTGEWPAIPSMRPGATGGAGTREHWDAPGGTGEWDAPAPSGPYPVHGSGAWSPAAGSPPAAPPGPSGPYQVPHSGEWPAPADPYQTPGGTPGGQAPGTGEWPATHGTAVPGSGEWPAEDPYAARGTGEWPATPGAGGPGTGETGEWDTGETPYAAPGTGEWPATHGTATPGTGEWPAARGGAPPDAYGAGGTGEWPAAAGHSPTPPAGAWEQDQRQPDQWSTGERPAGYWADQGSGEWPAAAGTGGWPAMAAPAAPEWSGPVVGPLHGPAGGTAPLSSQPPAGAAPRRTGRADALAALVAGRGGLHARLLTLLAPVVLLTLVGLVALWPRGPLPRLAEGLGGSPEAYHATVTKRAEEPCQGTEEKDAVFCQSVTVDLTSGPKSGTSVTFQAQESKDVPTLRPGDRIVVGHVPAIEESNSPEQYVFEDYQRDVPMLLLLALFVIVVLALGRLQGIRALAGLAASLVVVVFFLLPSLLDGRSPILVALVAASTIAFIALYGAHGVNERTTIALLGTLASLALTGVLAWFFVAFSRITGLASEEAVFLQFGNGQINLQGLVLAGIILGSLGVLDDVTVTQVSAVWELRKANPRYGAADLYRSALTVGRDHIASTVNTLVLAYAGAALPLLLFFRQVDRGFAQVLTGELLATEVVRTLVGSVGLVASVPLTTLVAAWVAARGTDEEIAAAAAGDHGH